MRKLMLAAVALVVCSFFASTSVEAKGKKKSPQPKVASVLPQGKVHIVSRQAALGKVGDKMFDPWYDLCLEVPMQEIEDFTKKGAVNTPKLSHVKGGFHHGMEAGSMSWTSRSNGTCFGTLTPEGSLTLILVNEGPESSQLGGHAHSVSVLRGKVTKEGDLFVIDIESGQGRESHLLNAAVQEVLKN